MRTSTYLNKATIFKATLLLLFVLNATMASAQCSAVVKVDQDRNARSTPAAGTYYSMLLVNKGNAPEIYFLSSENANATAKNDDGSSNAKNVVLNVEFLNKGLKPIREILVKPGETVNFFAHILVPAGTPADRWSATQVIAKSKTCSNYKVDTILRTLVISSDDN